VDVTRAARVVSLAVLIVAGCSSGDDGASGGASSGVKGGATTTAPRGEIFYAGHRSDVYSRDDRWLCRPDLARDLCSRDLDATVVKADGTLTPEPFVAAREPAFDCFYVYPTVQLGSEGNAAFEADHTQERFTVRTQAARFRTQCGVYAPLYRQRTILAPSDSGVDYGAIAYADVLDAFRYYMGNLNEGRPFVLMGHSQGAGHLRQLIAKEIDGNAELRERMISALLLGSSVPVPEGRETGGAFQNVAPCRTTSDVGCVVSYSSFRATSPPPDDSFFGRAREAGQRAVCTNPASLDGQPGALLAYFDTARTTQIIGQVFNVFAPDVADPPEITTPFVALPGLVSSKCVDRGPFSYLELTMNADPGPRVDTIGGDLTAQWGMHLVDMNVALGNLVALVGEQAAAWQSAH
jgi:hypothetical protein